MKKTKFTSTRGNPTDTITIYYGLELKWRRCYSITVTQVTNIGVRVLMYILRIDSEGQGIDCNLFSRDFITRHMSNNLIYVLNTHIDDPEIKIIIDFLFEANKDSITELIKYINKEKSHEVILHILNKYSKDKSENYLLRDLILSLITGIVDRTPDMTFHLHEKKLLSDKSENSLRSKLIKFHNV